jgi:hypothetical protein
MRNNILESTAKVTDKAVTGLFRWATTDHTGISQRLCNMPKMGFLDTLRYILVQLVLSIVAAVVTGALVFIVIAYGIPLLLFGHL